MDIIILCAGKGDRMGMKIPKAAIKIGGTPILSHNISMILSLAKRYGEEATIHVVTGYKSHMLADKEYPDNVIFYYNKDYKQGISLSVHTVITRWEKQVFDTSQIRIMDGDILMNPKSMEPFLFGDTYGETVVLRDTGSGDPSPISVRVSNTWKVQDWGGPKSEYEWGCAAALNPMSLMMIAAEDRPMWETLRDRCSNLNAAVADMVEVDTPEMLKKAEEFVKNGYTNS